MFHCGLWKESVQYLPFKNAEFQSQGQVMITLTLAVFAPEKALSDFCAIWIRSGIA